MDKPQGRTSHDCIDGVRRALRTRRVGHLGTLDPMATGLLVVLLGPATRLARLGADWSKTYEGTITFGAATDTDDADGVVIDTSDAWRTLTARQIEEAMREVASRDRQRPPAHSAKKIEGERAYAKARRGESVRLAAVPISVHEFTLRSWDAPRARFGSRVSSGGYIRALARDVGEAVGCPAHLSALRRTAVGPFAVTEAVGLDDVSPSEVASPARMATDLPRRDLTVSEWHAFQQGRQVTAPGVAADSLVAVFFADDLVGLAEVQGDALQPRVVMGVS